MGGIMPRTKPRALRRSKSYLRRASKKIQFTLIHRLILYLLLCSVVFFHQSMENQGLGSVQFSHKLSSNSEETSSDKDFFSISSSMLAVTSARQCPVTLVLRMRATQRSSGVSDKLQASKDEMEQIQYKQHISSEVISSSSPQPVASCRICTRQIQSLGADTAVKECMRSLLHNSSCC